MHVICIKQFHEKSVKCAGSELTASFNGKYHSQMMLRKEIRRDTKFSGVARGRNAPSSNQKGTGKMGMTTAKMELITAKMGCDIGKDGCKNGKHEVIRGHQASHNFGGGKIAVPSAADPTLRR